MTEETWQAGKGMMAACVLAALVVGSGLLALALMLLDVDLSTRADLALLGFQAVALVGAEVRLREWKRYVAKVRADRGHPDHYWLGRDR